MHILVLILGAVAAAGFWWYRIRAAGQVAGEVVDAAQRARGAITRKRFRDKANKSPYTAIDDPVVAAATLIIAMAEDQGRFDDRAEASLREALGPVSRDAELVEEAIVYGKWAAAQSVDASTPMRLISPYLVETLSVEEREQLMAIAEHVMAASGGDRGAQERLIDRLRNRLGFASTR
ncbi:hypothetical protein [Oricola sp.]|uniref:hypothetical protein n=1 Tax=Oricola sp. TaxID=1979950 RepID=UPI0025EDD1E9|nr:hypothetical protein [Oricola sp.]MCI5077633.1 hypothetical protein [Oricola sp.]